MKYLNARFIGALTFLLVAAFVVTACITEKQASDIDKKIDDGTKLVNGVLGATGNGAAAPVVMAGGALAKWIVGLFVAGGTGAAVTHRAHGGAFTGNTRRRKKQVDRHWDDLLSTANELVPQLTQIASVAGDTHAQKQAQKALQVLGALKAAQPAPVGA